ncbi:MAG: hypothetical protein ACYTG5_22250, partial [Planctomycetota bacterium]
MSLTQSQPESESQPEPQPQQFQPITGTPAEIVEQHTGLVRRIAYHLVSRLPASVQADDLI